MRDEKEEASKVKQTNKAKQHSTPMYMYMYMYMYIQVTALGVLCCFALPCLTLLASFFLPSHLSLKHVYIMHMYMYMYIYMYIGSSVGRALCLEYRVSWVRVPPEVHFVAHFF